MQKLKNNERKDWNIKIKQLLDHHNEALQVGEDESMVYVCMLINIFLNEICRTEQEI